MRPGCRSGGRGCISARLTSSEDLGDWLYLQLASSSVTTDSESPSYTRSSEVGGHSASQGSMTRPQAHVPPSSCHFLPPCVGGSRREVGCDPPQAAGVPGTAGGQGGTPPPLTCLLSLQIFAEGALPPLPSGAIAVNGRNLQTEAPSVRAELGTCPQRHVLFAPLTVLDHLLLFPSLKAPRGTHQELRGHVRR